LIPIPLALASSTDLMLPYFIGIIVILICSAFSLLVFPSLRQYRRKRNIVFYLTIILILILFAVQIGTIYEQAPRAFVEFGIDSAYSSKAMLVKRIHFFCIVEALETVLHLISTL